MDIPALPSLCEMAVSHHELYLSWVTAGFREDQAMDLLLTVIEAAIREGNRG